MKTAFVLALVCAGLVACCCAVNLPPSFDVNLDEKPADRWKPVYSLLFKSVTHLTIFAGLIQQGRQSLAAAGCDAACRSRLVSTFQARFPEYFEELQGIAEVAQAASLDVTAEDLVMEQLRYEWTILDIATPQQVTRDSAEKALLDELKLPVIGCTSTLVCNSENKVLHGRGLDWWRPDYFGTTMIHVNYKKGGKTIIQSEHLMGLIGFLTASKIGAFTMSINAKVVEGVETDPTLAQFLDCFDAVSMQPIMVGYRWYAENMASYEALIENVTTTPTCSPRYSIIGGIGKGCRIQHNINADYSDVQTVSIEEEDLSCSDDSWYVAQCNSDFDVPPTPEDDPRRLMVMSTFNSMGRQYGTTTMGVFHVLTSQYVLNERTVHTTVMSPNEGILLTVAHGYPVPLPTPTPTPTPDPSSSSSEEKPVEKSSSSSLEEEKSSQSCNCDCGVSSSTFVIPSFALLALVAFIFAL